MKRVLEHFRIRLDSGTGKSLGGRWPISMLLKRLNCWHEAGVAHLLLLRLADLEEQSRGDKYARVSETGLEKGRRAMKSLAGEIKEAKRRNAAGRLSPVESLESRYNALRAQIETLLCQDQNWGIRAENLRSERAELWDRVVQWAPQWQLTVKTCITETDQALQAAPRAKSPDSQLQLASRAVSRLRAALAYVDEVKRLNSRAAQVARRIQVLKPISGSYVSEDALSFNATLAAGQQAFTAGEYVKARRHLDAALQLGKRVASGNRAERMKRKAEAQEWRELLPDAEISEEISNVLGKWSSPEFAKQWEELHKKIDDLVLARACEMGNRDRKAIAERIGIKRTVRWRDQMEWADLERFAQAMIHEL